MRFRGLAPLLLLIVVGCSNAPALHVKEVAIAPLPAGWTQLASKDGDTSVGLPPGWYDRFAEKPLKDLMSTGSSEMGGEQSQLDQQFAEITRQMSDQLHENVQKKKDELYAKGILFEAYNSSRPVFDEVRTHILVQRKEGSGNWDWDLAADEERKHYAFKPKSETVQLPIGKALKLSASEELRNGSTIHRISYLAIEGKRLYALRFATEESRESIASISDSVAQTWKIKPSK